jgi:hypothetical protein
MVKFSERAMLIYPLFSGFFDGCALVSILIIGVNGFDAGNLYLLMALA